MHMHYGRNFNRKLAGMIMAFCVVVSSALGFGGGMVASQINIKNEAATQALQTSTQAAAAALNTGSADSLPITEITALTANSVVEITTEVVTTSGFMGQYITEGAGKRRYCDERRIYCHEQPCGRRSQQNKRPVKKRDNL